MHAMNRALGLTLALAAALAACSSDGGGEDGANGGATTACGGQGETFSVNMTKMGNLGEVSFTLVSSEPAPPQRFTNVWIVELKDSGGAPLLGATLEVFPNMPAHDHGSPEPVVVRELGDGRYELNPVNLFMRGLWETTIDATMSDGTTDSAMFAFCI
jgi:hypothetical protein